MPRSGQWVPQSQWEDPRASRKDTLLDTPFLIRTEGDKIPGQKARSDSARTGRYAQCTMTTVQPHAWTEGGTSVWKEDAESMRNDWTEDHRCNARAQGAVSDAPGPAAGRPAAAARCTAPHARSRVALLPRRRRRALGSRRRLAP